MSRAFLLADFSNFCVFFGHEELLRAKALVPRSPSSLLTFEQDKFTSSLAEKNRRKAAARSLHSLSHYALHGLRGKCTYSATFPPNTWGCMMLAREVMALVVRIAVGVSKFIH